MSKNMPYFDRHRCGGATVTSVASDEGVILAAVKCMIGVATRANEMKAKHGNLEEQPIRSVLSGSDGMVRLTGLAFKCPNARESRHTF